MYSPFVCVCVCVLEPRDINDFITNYFTCMRRDPRYSDCHMRVFIEANMSFTTAQGVHDLLKSSALFGNVDVVRFDPKGKDRPGVWTSKDAKHAYCLEIGAHIEHTYFTQQTCSSNAPAVLAEFYKQLGFFHEELLEPAGGAETALFRKSVLTGKGQGKKDDLFMAFGICIYHLLRSQSNVEFRNRCDAMGLAPG